MITIRALPAVHLTALTPDASVASAPDQGTLDALAGADLLISGLGAVLLLAWIGRCIARTPHDPLARAPDRPNQVREELLGVAIVGYVAGMLLLSQACELLLGTQESPTARTIITNGTQLIGILLCLVVARDLDGGWRRFTFGSGAVSRGRMLVLTLSAAVVTVGLCAPVRDLTVYLIEAVVPDFDFPPHPTIEYLHGPEAAPGLIIALWAGAVVLAPAAEEMFFRGLIQTLVWRRSGCRWTAIAATSVIFSLVHYQQIHALPALALLAVVIGFLYERTGSLVPPIAAHALFNLKTLIWDALLPPAA